MDSFNFSRIKSYLPADLPKLPTSLPQMPTLPFQLPTVGGLGTPPPASPSFPAETSYLSPTLNPQSSSSLGPLSPLDPRPLGSGLPKTPLDLINECDNFPYLSTHPERYLRHINTYYHLQVAAHPGVCLGYMLPRVAGVFEGLDEWSVDHGERTVVLTGGDTTGERSAIVAKTAAAMRATGFFKVLDGWRDEVYDVHGPEGESLFTVERAASCLLGVVTYGCHLTAYTRTRVKIEGEEGQGNEEIRVWVPRRAKSKQTYGGMLDNTVAGGLAAGEVPLECMLREAQEEASLPEAKMKKRVKAAGVVSYFHIRDERAGGETGLLQPECQYVYDADLTGLDIEPKPEDGEAEEFTLMGVDEVKEALGKGEFKPNCALVLLDFFVRHGIMTPETEKDYVQIVTRLRRGIDFPMR